MKSNCSEDTNPKDALPIGKETHWCRLCSTLLLSRAIAPIILISKKQSCAIVWYFATHNASNFVAKWAKNLLYFARTIPSKNECKPKKTKKKKNEKKNRTSGKSWQSSKNRKKENCISPKQRNLRRTFEILLNSNKISSCVAGERGRERKVQRPISKWQLSRGSTESAERGKNIGAYQRAKKKNKKSEVECRSKSDTWTGAVVNISKESWKEYWLRASAH